MIRRLILVALLLTTACGDENGPVGPVTATGSSVPRCGEAITAGGPLSIRGAFPSRVARGGDGTFAGQVTVTAGAGAVAGTTSPEADVWVAQAGKVVAAPLAKDLVGRPLTLAPGASADFPARGAIVPCAGPAGGLLAPGRYEVFATVTVVDDGGAATVATGGPWPLEVA